MHRNLGLYNGEAMNVIFAKFQKKPNAKTGCFLACGDVKCTISRYNPYAITFLEAIGGITTEPSKKVERGPNKVNPLWKSKHIAWIK